LDTKWRHSNYGKKLDLWPRKLALQLSDARTHFGHTKIIMYNIYFQSDLLLISY